MVVAARAREDAEGEGVDVDVSMMSTRMASPGTFTVTRRRDGKVVYAGFGKNCAKECAAYLASSSVETSVADVAVRFYAAPKAARGSVLKAKFRILLQTIGYVPEGNAVSVSALEASAATTSASVSSPMGSSYVFRLDELEELQRVGYVVLDDAFPREDAVAASEAAKTLFERGVMQNLNQEGRDDDVAVLSTTDMPGGTKFSALKPCAAFLLDIPAALRRALAAHDTDPENSRTKFTPDFRAKCARAEAPSRLMIARYHAAHARYVAHLDNDPSDNGNAAGEPGLRPCDRTFTCIAYLNPNWVPAHAGHFRAYALGVSDPSRVADDAYADLDPVAGRVVVFDSARLLHEVRPSRAERYAMTVWT